MVRFPSGGEKSDVEAAVAVAPLPLDFFGRGVVQGAAHCLLGGSGRLGPAAPW